MTSSTPAGLTASPRRAEEAETTTPFASPKSGVSSAKMDWNLGEILLSLNVYKEMNDKKERKGKEERKS